MQYQTVKAIQRVQQERLDLGLRKNKDYSGEIDNLSLTGLQGIAVRILDKACRLYNLTKPGKEAQVKSETIEDTLKDLGNYADYGCVIHRKEWHV